MVGVRRGERLENAGDGRPRAKLTSGGRRVAECLRPAHMRREKRRQPCELDRSGRRLEQRLQRLGGLDDDAQRRPRRFVAVPVSGEHAQPIALTQVSRIAQPAVERGDRSRRQVSVRSARTCRPLEVRRSKQRDRRVARELRRHELDDDVERGRERLGRERQRVEGVIRKARAAEHLASQIQVRQRPLEDDRRAVEMPGSGRSGRFHPARDDRKLLFAIAAHEQRKVARSSRRDQGRRRCRSGGANRASLDFLDAGKPVVHALMQTGGEQLLGDDEIDRLEAGKTRQQIEVHRMKAVRIGDPIGDGDDDVPNRIGRGR
ncbi:MAG TPA: hypothetical protein VII31_08925, partial [Caldimonas sp.]